MTTQAITTLQEAFKSKAKFEELMVNQAIPDEINAVLTKYPSKRVERISDLTQNYETFFNKFGDPNFSNNNLPYLVWIVTKERENILNALNLINNNSKNLNLFVFKAYLNEDKTVFECLLKPNLQEKRIVNYDTPIKNLQKDFWTTYKEVCDLSEYFKDVQILEAKPRHYQNISIGKTGIQILLTVNMHDNFVSSEIAISNDKTKYAALEKHKDEIEKQVGELLWDSKENNKSAKIRKVIKIDVNNPQNHKTASQLLMKSAYDLKQSVYKYL